MKDALLLISLLVAPAWNTAPDAEKPKDASIKNGLSDAPPAAVTERGPRGDGHRFTLTDAAARVPVAVVLGTPIKWAGISGD